MNVYYGRVRSYFEVYLERILQDIGIIALRVVKFDQNSGLLSNFISFLSLRRRRHRDRLLYYWQPQTKPQSVALASFSAFIAPLLSLLFLLVPSLSLAVVVLSIPFLLFSRRRSMIVPVWEGLETLLAIYWW